MMFVAVWFILMGETWFFSDDSLVLKIGLTVADTMLFGGGIVILKFKQLFEKYHKIILFMIILGVILMNLLPEIIN